MKRARGIAVAGPDDIWIAGYNGGCSGTDPDGSAHCSTWTVDTRAAAGRLCAIDRRHPAARAARSLLLSAS